MKKELKIESYVDNLTMVLSFIRDYLKTIDCPTKIQTQIAISVEEIFVNIASYAYYPNSGIVKILIESIRNNSTLEITFIDSGRPFTPLENKDPDISIEAEERPIGGLGILMTKKAMDEVAYDFKEGKNILVLRKIIIK